MRKPLICLLFACIPAFADDDSFREKFADPETRASALAELIPGTRDAFFHTALDHQLAGREAEFRQTMAAWRAAAARKQNPVSSNGLAILENRQLLIDYRKLPQSSLAELIRRLDLKFDDARPDAAAAAQSLPTRLDPALVTEAAFEKAAAGESPKSPYTEFRGQRLLRELDRVETFDEAKIRWFIENLDRADLPGIVPLIDRSLSLEKPVSFGSAEIHRKLTSKQLASLMDLHPDLKSNADFAMAWLRQLRPGAETDFQRDLQAHADHLSRCRDFVLKLPPALNTLKAHVLFHHLRLQQELGKHPKDDFLTFLALPRQRHEILRVTEADAKNVISLDADFSAATACPPVRDDLPLIQSYLHHFLSQSDAHADFAPLIPERILMRIHARARLLAGENPERWGTLIDPTEFKALQAEARISFAPGAPLLLASDAAVSLTVDLKNTPELLVRIYELDLPAHLARHGGEPDVTIDLDGLVPHHDRRIAYAQAPIVQHRESIALPELTGPGAWLVEFVGGQVSARALIRKGRLTAFPERTADGQTLRVFDETGKPPAKASLQLGRETFNSDANGRINIPNAPNQPVTQGLILAGKLATPVTLGPRADQLELETRFHLDREQLLAEREARVLLRPRLTNHGHELPLDRIKDPALVLKAELLGGIATERVIAGNLDLKPVMEVPFQVPADLLKLTLILRGTITPATGGDPVKLDAGAVYQINGDLKLARIGTAFFSPVAGGHRLEIRGRNGEPLPSRAITLKCSRLDYNPPVELRVRTDDEGRVDLGTLDTIDYLSASGTDIAETFYQPRLRRLDYTSNVQVPAGTEIRLPLEKPAAAPDRMEISLLELSGGNPIRDHFDKLAIGDGQLVIRGLPAGDYQLKQGGETTDILVSSGTEKDGLLVSETRILPRHAPLNPTIAKALAENNELVVQLRDHGPGTRVSVIGKRYEHFDWNAGSGLYPFSPPVAGLLAPGFTGCGYLTERRLSGEMRYILDRRAAKTFPGSMLPRPGLLLNRWTEEEMFQSTLTGADGSEGGGGSGNLPSAMKKRPKPEKRGRETGGRLASICDFLAVPAVTRLDLTPDADGSLRLPLADFAGCQFVEIIAADAFADESRIVPLPASETPLRDRRIARPLDPKTHYLATRSAAVLAKGATASIENLLDADWRAFTTLAEAHQFLFGMKPDDRLREFIFLTEWPDLTEERKLELLSKHACHELHLFLARKDKEFFDKHVKPLLAGKPEPGFIDDLLLGRDLKPYLRGYAWQRLNAAEKALLAQALPDAGKRIARELSLRWELEAPGPDAETVLFTQTLRGTDLALEDSLGLARRDLMPPQSGGLAFIRNKLKSIIIPRIDFEDVTVEEAVDFLRLRATELDTLELDPARKGISFVVRRPRVSAGDAGLDAGIPGGGDPGALRIKELKLRNVPLSDALKYICDATKLRYKVDDYAITLVPQTETGEDIFTRTFQVPPDFAEALQGGGGGDVDPFAEPSTKSAKLRTRKPIIELLRESGINFPEGTSATISANGILLVTNNPSELDKVEQLTAVLSSRSEELARDATGRGFAPDDFVLPEMESLGDEPAAAAADPFAAPAKNGGKALLARKAIAPLFPDRTKLWREANYYRNTEPADERLIPLNRFWIDLAGWDGKGAFLSPHFNACHKSANEALMCLALLDLPFKAERPEVSVDGGAMRVKAREPMLLFYKDTRRADIVADESPLLVRQSFSPLAEKFRTVNGRQVENPVSGDFRPGLPYSASLIVTNPTGIGRRIDVLAQIPAGSIPLEGKPATLSATVEVEPHGVLKLELAFYFPAAGDFAVYPMHVSEDGVVLAHTGPRSLRVSNKPEPRDAASWLVLASEGSDEEVLARLLTENLKTIDLGAIRWRLKDRAFFLKVAAILRDRLHFPVQVASFGFLHNDVQGIREYLENSDAVHQLGQWLDSPLLDVRPRTHHDWQTLEFDPLVNARAHRFTHQSRMTHEAARGHYHAFLDQLAWKPALDASDQLALTAFLFLQDRVEEGLARFAKIDPAALPGRLNYDYLHAVVLFHQEKPADAQAIAAAVLPGLPPGLWRDRFQTVLDQAAEIAALDQPAEDAKPDVDGATPRLDLVPGDAGNVVIRHRALEKATLRLFSVDLEVLFSKNPFLQGGNDNGEPAIRANEIIEVPLAKDVAETSVALPEALRKGNVLVAAESGEMKVLKVLDSRAMELRHLPAERTVQVLDAATRRPLTKTYVKVYAENRDGGVVFHKDGYTDLRGKFDYLSHTGADPSSIKRVALLASHPEKGARTVIYDR